MTSLLGEDGIILEKKMFFESQKNSVLLVRMSHLYESSIKVFKC